MYSPEQFVQIFYLCREFNAVPSVNDDKRLILDLPDGVEREILDVFSRQVENVLKVTTNRIYHKPNV